MSKRVGEHLRSNLVGYVALFFALSGGVAWATHPGGADTISTGDIIDTHVRTADIGSGAVQSGDIAGDAVTSGKIVAGGVKSEDVLDGSLLGADVAPDTLGADDIASGAIGTEELSADALGARAYGRVSASGSLSRSKNIDGVTKPATGVYCIDPAEGIDPATAVLIVSPELTGTDTSTALGDVSHVEWIGSGGNVNCPDATTLEVATYLYKGDITDDDGGLADSPGDLLMADDEAFAFMVP